jgi:hypothetical protein
VALHSIVPVDHLELIGNGEVVAQIPLTDSRTFVSTTVKINAERSGWYLLRARGDGPSYPVLDVYPYATTSPIYLKVGNGARRSSRDAEYFLQWIDRLEAGAEKHQGWNNEEEKSAVLQSIRQARAEFERRRQE